MREERVFFHLFQLHHYDEQLEERFGRYAGLVVNPAIPFPIVEDIHKRLPNALLLAAEVNSTLVAIPPDGSEPPWEYGQEIKRTFPSAALWRNVCSGALVSEFEGTTNYTLSQAVVDWWVSRVDRLRAAAYHGLYNDNSPEWIAAWLVERWKSLGYVDVDGDHWPEKMEEVADRYAFWQDRLTSALRSAWPGLIVANTGTPRADARLNGIGLEIAGIPAVVAAEAFVDAIAVARRPKVNVAWCAREQDLAAWREVRARDPRVWSVYIGEEDGGVDVLSSR